MAGPLRQISGRGREHVPPGGDQARRGQGRHFSGRGEGAKIDADSPERFCTCRRQIPSFSCHAPESRGSVGTHQKIQMIRPILIGLVLISLFTLSPSCRAVTAEPPEAEVVDGVAAVVNGDVITYSQVRGLVGPREKMLRSQFHGDDLAAKIKEARQHALQDLIDRQLIIQAFKKENYQIPDHFVEDRMHDIIRTDFGGDRNTFIKTLEAQNFTMGEFKKMETEKMIVQAMRSKNVKLNSIASPAKVEEYYKAHRDEFTSKAQIKLRLIMIPSHASDGNAAAEKAMADEIFGKLVNAAEFERMAQLYSEDSTREHD